MRRIEGELLGCGIDKRSVDSWMKTLEKKEWHHIWPQWMLGKHEQARFLLPRALHNFVRTKGTGGFHQHFSRLFKNSGIIELSKGTLFHEMKREDFDRKIRGLPNDIQAEILDVLNGVVEEAYQNTFGENELEVPLKSEIEKEFERIERELATPVKSET